MQLGIRKEFFAEPFPPDCVGRLFPFLRSMLAATWGDEETTLFTTGYNSGEKHQQTVLVHLGIDPPRMFTHIVNTTDFPKASKNVRLNHTK